MGVSLREGEAVENVNDDRAFGVVPSDEEGRDHTGDGEGSTDAVDIGEE